jgi:hypothetical protein
MGYSELLGFWSLSIVQGSKRKKKKQRSGNWIRFRPRVRGGDTYSVGYFIES